MNSQQIHQFESPPMSPNKKKTPPSREEGCEGEMAKKNRHAFKSFSLRSRFNSLIALIFMAIIVVVGISLRWPEEPAAVVGKGSAEICDLFSGRWVYDNSTYPLYSEQGCKFMSDQSAMMRKKAAMTENPIINSQNDSMAPQFTSQWTTWPK